MKKKKRITVRHGGDAFSREVFFFQCNEHGFLYFCLIPHRKRSGIMQEQNNTTKRSIIAIGFVVSSTRIIALDILSFISREICKMHTFHITHNRILSLETE